MHVEPCRRCGNETPLQDGLRAEGKKGGLWRVICTRCGARTSWEAKRDGAIKKWNDGVFGD